MENKNKTQEELQQQFAEAIKANPNFQHFFKDYMPSTVNSFISSYALKKAVWTLYGPTFRKELDKLEIQWEDEAIQRLEEIQQVKLFLFQCNFRAGAIQEPVEGVKTIFDFLYWKENILNARFLEPVTEEDISLYADYLVSPDVNHQPLGFLEDWQDFDEIRKAYNEDEDAGREVPEWYEFYFSHTGHGFELTLPDIKTEKDIFYFQLGNNERSRLILEEEKKAIAENPALAPEKGEYFNPHADDNLVRFMNVFEDEENRDLHKVYEAWSEFNETEDMLRDDLDMLMYAKENVPVEENENWIEAIQIAAANYRSKKIAESLPAAYNQYKMNLDLNITFPEKENSRKQPDFYNNLVLLGRKLNGEPEDFNY